MSCRILSYPILFARAWERRRLKVNVDVLDVDDVEDMSALCRAIVVVQEMMRVCASCVVQGKLDWVGLIVTNMLSRNREMRG